MTWLQKAADGGLELGQPVQSLESPQSPQGGTPQNLAQPREQAPEQAQPQGFNLQAFLESDPEAAEIVDWLSQLKNIVKPYWDAQNLLQKKLLNAGVTNIAQQAPQIAKLFESLNGV